MSSDRPPSDLEGFHRRLLSRLKCGLITEMQKPDLETRIAIIESKIEQNSFKLAPSMIQRIAEAITTSVRELEGAITSLIAYDSLNKKSINEKLVEQVIQGIAKEQEKPPFDIKRLQKMVADYYGVTLEGIKGRVRTRELATARHVGMFLTRTFVPDMTLQAIGHHFGRRDHSTVSYGIKSIEDLQHGDRLLRKAIQEIKTKVERETSH